MATAKKKTIKATTAKPKTKKASVSSAAKKTKAVEKDQDIAKKRRNFSLFSFRFTS